MKELKLECLVEGYEGTYFEVGQIWETRNRRKIVLKGFTGNATYPLLFDMGNNRYKEFTLKGNLFEDFEYRLDLVKPIYPKFPIKSTLPEQPKTLSEYLKENNAYESFIENCIERALLDPESFEQKRGQEENKDMGDFFIWESTKQGHDYWYNLYIEQPKNIIHDMNEIIFAEVDKRINLNMEEKLKKTCIIQSGGLESCTMLLDVIINGLEELGHKPTEELFNEMIQNKDPDYIKVVESIFPITFDYGQKNNKELEVVQKYCDKLLVKPKIIKMSHFSELCGNSTALLSSSNLEAKKALDNIDCSQVNTYVPFRNAQFIFAAACFAESNGCEQLYMGINAGDLYGYWDTSTEFITHVKAILAMNRENKIKLVTPFINDFKVNIVNKGIQLSTKTGILPADFAWSCYTRGSSHHKECGECSTCVEKIVGMLRSGYFSVDDIINKFDNVNEEKLKQYLQVL